MHEFHVQVMKLQLMVKCCCVDGDCRMVSGAAVPAHRLHDVKKHWSSQIRAEVDEHGENDHGQAQSLLVVFLQHGRTVSTPVMSHWISQMLALALRTLVLRHIKLLNDSFTYQTLWSAAHR